MVFSEKSHSFAQQTKNEYLISSTIFNLGKRYFHLEKYTEALSHFNTSCAIFEKNETSHAPKSYFNKLLTLLKLGQLVPAAEPFEKGGSAAQQLNDKIYEEEMKFLYCLYFQSKTPNAITELKRCLDNLQKQKSLRRCVSTSF
ncbi:hypothetical protein ACL9ST_10835 [Bacillus australimaris]|uniref:hypothetical protein n=1 Tax=Bacillus australimaris TaxID=1326968 RepID=UPI0039B639B3